MVVDENNQLYPSMMHLFRVSLLIPPSTANVERAYSVIHLLCSSLRSSFNQASLDRLQIYISGSEPLSDLHCDYLLQQFKHKRGNKRIDL